MSSRHLRRLLGLAALLCAGLSTPALAGTISVAWDPVDYPDLAGYRLYYDTNPDTFGHSLDVGSVNSVTLSGMQDCTAYWVAVKARNSAGAESDAYSNVITGWPRPVAATLTPATVEQNSTRQIVLDGSNFQQGAVVTFTDPAISVTGLTYESCTRVRVDVSVGGAAPGPRDIRVINPGQVFGVGVGLLSVVPDGTGPTITAVAATGVAATTATIGWVTSEPADSQLFFRRQGESTYQTAPTDASLATTHAMLLQGLAPETTYDYYVRSADAAGNATTSTPAQSFTTVASTHSYLRFEAEAGVRSTPLVSATGAGVFSGAWVELPTGSPAGTTGAPSGTAQFGFYVPHAGTWQVWVRTYGTTAQAGSWFEKVDGAAFDDFAVPGPGAWHWVAARSYDLAQGLHGLTLGGRVAGSRADRILVTDDPDFVPTEQPGDDVTPPSPVAGLIAVSSSGANALSWTNPSGTGALTVVVRFRLDGQVPVSPIDGLPLAETSVTAGTAGSLQHAGLTNGVTYTYAVFVVDASGNASAAASVQATPALDPPPTVQNVTRTDVM